MRRPVYVVDAFSDQPLSGNPAGVVLDCAELGADEMKRIARELRHSETAFPLPAREPTAALHLRWFTPTEEVAFCGHATLATFHVLALEAKRLRVPESGVAKVAFTCKAGKLRAELSRDGGAMRALIETPRATFERAQVPGALIHALGLVPEVLDPTLPATRSQSAEGNLFLALRDREALRRARPDFAAVAELGRALAVFGVCLYVRDPEAGVDAAVRFFCPAQGIDEDPVTGSIGGQLALLLQHALPEEMPRTFHFTQGEEVGRPGRVEVVVRPEETPGEIRVWITGACAVVLRGELDLQGRR